jgi:ergot alkaloid biosynthesis protein
MTAGSILVTGATGKTGRRIVERLHGLGRTVRAASRTGDGTSLIRFDWFDPTTFELASKDITAAYLLAPSGVYEVLSSMKPFIDHLLEAGVGRLVLLSASSLEPGGPMMGAVHSYLAANAPSWTVLRPSWFMQNFSEQQHLATLRNERAIYSATGDGRVGFVSADDIAAVAARALSDPDMPNTDLILTGPEPLSYDDVADSIGAAIGQRITHHKLAPAALATRFEVLAGLSPDYARVLAGLDAAVAKGREDRVTDNVARITGRQPVSFAEYATGAAAVWKL